MEREAHNSRTWGWEEDASSSYKITRRMTSFAYYHVKLGSFYSITLVDRSIKHNVPRSQDGLPMCEELVDPDCMGRVVFDSILYSIVASSSHARRAWERCRSE